MRVTVDSRFRGNDDFRLVPKFPFGNPDCSQSSTLHPLRQGTVLTGDAWAIRGSRTSRESAFPNGNLGTRFDARRPSIIRERHSLIYEHDLRARFTSTIYEYDEVPLKFS